MFDFDELSEQIDAEEESIRREDEERTRIRRKSLERRRKAEEEKARIQKLREEEHAKSLQAVRTECEQVDFNGDWSDDPEQLTTLLQTVKEWMVWGVQSLRSDAQKLMIPTTGVPLGGYERNALIERMKIGLVWSKLSKGQLHEELNRRGVAFVAGEEPTELRKRLIIDAYGVLADGTAGLSLGSNIMNMEPRSKDDPAPASPWTGQLAELGPAPDGGRGKKKGTWQGITAGRSSGAPTWHSKPAAASGDGQNKWADITPGKSSGRPMWNRQPKAAAAAQAAKPSAASKAQQGSPTTTSDQRSAQDVQRLEKQKQEEQQRREEERARQERARQERARQEQKREEEQRQHEERLQQERQQEQKRRQQRTQRRQIVMAKLDDEYSALGLASGATLTEVRRSYRSLALLHHPDKQNSADGDASMFRRVTEAYHAIAEHLKDLDD